MILAQEQAGVAPHASVGDADLEGGLAVVRAAAAGRAGGVFGPGSLVWRVDREAAVFLAAGRAVLLQLAHPWVAAAIAEHSRSLADPVGRFHRTFAFVFTMVFGTTDGRHRAAALRPPYGGRRRPRGRCRGVRRRLALPGERRGRAVLGRRHIGGQRARRL
jgi:mpaB/rubber oxygenase-like protein